MEGDISVGDLVRLIIPLGISTDQRFTTELFRVVRILKERKPFLVQVADLAGSVVDQLYYVPQLSLVFRSDDV